MDTSFNRPYGIYDQSRGFGAASASSTNPSITQQSKVFGSAKRGTDPANSLNPTGWPLSRSSSVSNIPGSSENDSNQPSQQDPLSGFNAFSDGESTQQGQQGSDYASYQQQQQQQQYEAYANSYASQYPQYFAGNQYGSLSSAQQQYSGFGGNQYYGGYMPYMQYGGAYQTAPQGSLQSYAGAAGATGFGTAAALRSPSVSASVDGDSIGKPNIASVADGIGGGTGWNPALTAKATDTLPERINSATTLLSPKADSNQQADAYVDPGTIQWCYIDLSGQEQGPFPGTMMNEWLMFFAEYTMLRRSKDSMYLSYGNLILVTNSNEPFIVKLSAKEWDQCIQKAIEKTQQMQQQQQQQYDELESAHGSQVGAQQPQHDVETKLPKDENIHQSLSTTKKNASVPSDALVGLSLDDKDTGVEAVVSPTVKKSKLKDVHPKQQHKQPQSQPKSAQQAPSQKPVQQTQNSEQQQQHQLSTPNQQTIQMFPQPAQPTKVVKAEPARAPVTDPWKKPAIASPQVSISELKQQELEKQQLKKKAAQQASTSGTTSSSSRRTSQQRNWLPLEEVQKAEALTMQNSSATAPAASEPSTPTWAKKVVPPARSLADIQREQAIKAEKAKQRSTPASNVAPAVASTPAISTKSNRYQALDPSSGATSSNAPTTSRNSSVPSPSKSRQQRPFQSITQAVNAAKPTDELIHWARVQFKELAKGIDQMELLEVFLSLPSNANAREFIAESIFGYSSTIDSRKFASDFIARKKDAEKTMPENETWKDVLSRFNPNVQEQDPSFKVVTKKRGPKIVRPQ